MRREEDDDEEEGEDEGGGEVERAKAALWVLPLHGALSGADQSLVFRTVLPAGKSKVGVGGWKGEVGVLVGGFD